MTNRFSVLVGSTVLAAGMAFIPSIFDSANAATVSFQVTNKISDDTTPIFYDVTLSDITGGGVKVTLAQSTNTPNNGDLFGAFFNIAGSPTTSSNVVTGTNVTNYAFNTSNLGGGNNVTPAGPFDIGVTFGRSGSSGGLLKSTMFNITGVTVNDFLNQSFAIRAQTSGPGANGGNGSTKVIGTVPSGTAVPEPLTMLGAGAAVGFGTIFKKRLAKAQKKDI